MGNASAFIHPNRQGAHRLVLATQQRPSRGGGAQNLVRFFGGLNLCSQNVDRYCAKAQVSDASKRCLSILFLVSRSEVRCLGPCLEMLPRCGVGASVLVLRTSQVKQ